jgi:hypothetical protein
MSFQKLVFVIVLGLLCSFQAVAGVDATNCTFTSITPVVYNGTNAVKVTVEYPSSWTSWKMKVSTDLRGSGNWRNFDTGEILGIEAPVYGVLPRVKSYFVKLPPFGALFFRTTNTTVTAGL